MKLPDVPLPTIGIHPIPVVNVGPLVKRRLYCLAVRLSEEARLETFTKLVKFPIPFLRDDNWNERMLQPHPANEPIPFVGFSFNDAFYLRPLSLKIALIKSKTAIFPFQNAPNHFASFYLN